MTADPQRLTPANPYQTGYKAFLAKQHYNLNPYGENNLAADEWDRGWGDANRQNPGAFCQATESFTID